MVLSIDRVQGKEQMQIEEKTGDVVNGRVRVLKKRSRFGSELPVYLKINKAFQAFYDLSMDDFYKPNLEVKAEEDDVIFPEWEGDKE
jgi:hypothetical protein